jgi:hypothetical protein
LIKIRKREEEAFIKYRQALNEAIDTYKSISSSFSERDARALYSDVIAPGLANLNQSVQVAKRDLVKRAYRSVVAVVGAISFGLYTGFIPTELAEMAKVIGFTKIATDILGNLLRPEMLKRVLRPKTYTFFGKSESSATQFEFQTSRGELPKHNWPNYGSL